MIDGLVKQIFTKELVPLLAWIPKESSVNQALKILVDAALHHLCGTKICERLVR